MTLRALVAYKLFAHQLIYLYTRKTPKKTQWRECELLYGHIPLNLRMLENMPSHSALIVPKVCCFICIPQLVGLAIPQFQQLQGMPSVERKSAAQSSSALCIGSQPCSQPTSFLVGCRKMMEDAFCPSFALQILQCAAWRCMPCMQYCQCIVNVPGNSGDWYEIQHVLVRSCS